MAGKVGADASGMGCAVLGSLCGDRVLPDGWWVFCPGNRWLADGADADCRDSTDAGNCIYSLFVVPQAGKQMVRAIRKLGHITN